MKLLPMLGLTHGNRSPVTCALKCDNACAHPIPNQSTEPSFREVATAQLSRRRLLAGAGALAAGVTAGGGALSLQPAAASPKGHPGETGGAVGTGALSFTPIDPVPLEKDALTVPDGYAWTPILRWGDPLFHNSPAFNPDRPNADAQELQFGYNNDYTDVIVTDRAGREALLVCNHEYTNRGIMFAETSSDAEELEVIRTLIAAHGFSVVELERQAKGRTWSYVQGARLNRRITGNTEFEFDGPAAGGTLLQTAADPAGKYPHGTLGNCSGGTTPWGTILSGEENFNGYFVADPNAVGSARYGLTGRASTYGFEKVDPRFDATNSAYAHEPHRFGWVVEIDPYDPNSTPKKHTALGRFKHEAANVRVDDEGNVAVYMGDDEKFDYLYKFVAKRKYIEGNRKHNKKLLSEGDLYVAKFSGEQAPDNANLGTGEWLPLTQDGESVIPGMSTEEVLVFTRLAADKLGATPMDRPEDVEPSPVTGKVYVVCTNNSDRGVKPGKPGADAANPRTPNKDGHIVELTEHRSRVDATTFTWDLFLVCGDPDVAGTYFGGYDGEVSPISCPDNIAFDSKGDLWISTDGAPSGLKLADGLFRVPLTGKERGKVSQFLAVPNQAETCGPVIHDRDGSVFVAVQHPGEEGGWDDQQSYFPDYVAAGSRPRRGAWRGPRPAIVQVTRKRH
ncbi:MAG TPA: PhoX family phosphatase [Microlunatus sp.]